MIKFNKLDYKILNHFKYVIMAIAIMFLSVSNISATSSFGQMNGEQFWDYSEGEESKPYFGQTFYYSGNAPNLTITDITIRGKKMGSPDALAIAFIKGKKITTYAGQDVMGINNTDIIAFYGFASSYFTTSKSDVNLNFDDFNYDVNKNGRNFIVVFDQEMQTIDNQYNWYFTDSNPLYNQNMITSTAAQWGANSSSVFPLQDLALLVYYEEKFDDVYTDTYINFNSSYNYNDDVNLTYHVYNPDFVTTKYKILVYYPDGTLYDQGFITENDLEYWVIRTINAVGRWTVKIISYPRLHPLDITTLAEGFFDVGGEGYAGSSLKWSKANYGTGETAYINYTIADSYSSKALTQNKLKIWDLSTKNVYYNKPLIYQNDNVSFVTYTEGAYGALLYNHNYVTGESVNLAYTAANFVAGLDSNEFGLSVTPDSQVCNGQITLKGYSPAVYNNLYINTTLNDVLQTSDKMTGTMNSYLHYYKNKSGKFEVALENETIIKVLAEFTISPCTTETDGTTGGDTAEDTGDVNSISDLDYSTTGAGRKLDEFVLVLGMGLNDTSKLIFGVLMIAIALCIMYISTHSVFVAMASGSAIFIWMLSISYIPLWVVVLVAIVLILKARQGE